MSQGKFKSFQDEEDEAAGISRSLPAQPPRAEPEAQDDGVIVIEMSTTYCTKTLLMAIMIFIVALCFLLISIAIIFWNDETRVSSPVIPNPTPPNPCGTGTPWQRKYCSEWTELIGLFSALSQTPSILGFCQQPYHLTVVSPNSANPVTKTGNVVENGVWQYALQESPYSNGTRLSSTDAFHMSILNGDYFPFTSNFNLVFPNPNPSDLEFTINPQPPPFRFDVFGSISLQRRLNFFTLCETLVTFNSPKGAYGDTNAVSGITFEDLVLYGSVSVNNDNQLDPFVYVSGTDQDRFRRNATLDTVSYEISCEDTGCTFIERASYLPQSIGDLSIIPTTVDAARDYKSAYGALCEVAVNGYLNTAFPSLIGAIQKTRGSYRAWCDLAAIMKSHPTICGYDPIFLMNARWPVIPDSRPGSIGTSTVFDLVSSIRCYDS